jgi:hypothetical protein
LVILSRYYNDSTMAIDYHNILIKCDPALTVWRYISIEKFESLVVNNALFFCRADKFPDIFEGSLPKSEYEWRFERFKQRSAAKGKAYDHEKAKAYAANFSHRYKTQRPAMVVSCWHINQNESTTMWGTYLKDTNGVVIKTTVARLLKSLENAKEKIRPSKVRYINYETGHFYDENDYPHEGENTLIPLIHKKIEYEGEQEYRLFHYFEEAEKAGYWETRKIPDGLLISCDVDTLIDQIIVHPFIEDKEAKLVEDILRSLGLENRIAQSSLKNLPLF